MKTLDMVPDPPKTTPRVSNPSDDQVASSEIVDQDLKRASYSQILCEVCREHNVLPASCIAHDVVSGKTDRSGVFVVRGPGEPAARVPEEFATNVYGVYICEGRQAGKPVRIMAFRTLSEANNGRIKCVSVLAVSVKQTLISFQQRLYSEVTKWKRVPFENVLPFLGISEAPQFFIISPWMSNGSILSYIKRNPRVNRLLLVRVEDTWGPVI